MGLFGGSSNKTNQQSTQVGASDNAIILGEGANYTNEFSPAVADFASHTLDLLGTGISSAFDNAKSLLGQSQQAIDTLGTVAQREKTPLSEWLPLVAIGATALVFAAYAFRRH